MEICCGGDCLLPPSSAPYPYLLNINTESEGDVDDIFCTIPAVANELPKSQTHYHCRIPQLRRREVLGCFHGWLILSKVPDNLEFCLWNPETFEFIQLPRLKLKPAVGGDDNNPSTICAACLTAPPSNPDSVILLSRFNPPNIVFCWLGNKIKRWTEMSYAWSLRNITTYGEDLLTRLVCCNGKVYSTTQTGHIILVNIRIDHTNKNRNVVISLSEFVRFPHYGQMRRSQYFFTGSSRDLFSIVVRYRYLLEEIQSLHLFKLDFSTMMWEEMKTAKDRVFFLNEIFCTLISCPAIESESGSGSYIHIIRDTGKVCSYNMEDKTISLFSFPCPDLPPEFLEHYISLWVVPESRLVGDDGEARCQTDTKENEKDKVEFSVVRRSVIDIDRMMNEQQLGEKTKASEGPLLNIPFHIQELIAGYCVAVEYLNFRATCKCCLLAAPAIQWSTATALGRLQKHSLLSPWLMVLDNYQGLITFTDPKFGHKYFMTTLPESNGNVTLCSSKYGWVLISRGGLRSLVFFNPFTRAIIELPELPHSPYMNNFFSGCGFSAPPTSPDCIVIVFAPRRVRITSPGKDEWRTIHFSFEDQLSHYSPTFCGRSIYILCRGGELGTLRIDTDYSGEIVVPEPPRTSCNNLVQRYLVECNADLISIVVAELGEWVEVFRLNCTTLQWEKVDSLGKHMIYVCGTTSFSVVATTPGMENKIYFPRFHGGNIVFYSLDTCKYHTSGGKEEALMNFFPTKEQLLSVWIEPSWSS